MVHDYPLQVLLEPGETLTLQGEYYVSTSPLQQPIHCQELDTFLNEATREGRNFMLIFSNNRNAIH